MPIQFYLLSENDKIEYSNAALSFVRECKDRKKCLLHRLKEKIPVVLAITISVLFFSVGHFDKMFVDGTLIGIIGIINLLLISLIFVIITLKNKNIYAATGFHFIWNFALFNIIGLNLSGLEITNSIFKMEVVNKFLTGYSYGIESSIICTIVLSIILSISIIRKKV